MSKSQGEAFPFSPAPVPRRGPRYPFVSTKAMAARATRAQQRTLALKRLAARMGWGVR